MIEENLKEKWNPLNNQLKNMRFNELLVVLNIIRRVSEKVIKHWIWVHSDLLETNPMIREIQWRFEKMKEGFDENGRRICRCF